MTTNLITTSSVSNQIISIGESVIGGEFVNSVDARELHKFLEIKKQFTDWISPKISEYGFAINSDFYPSRCISINGRSMETYVISLDMAKELSMISRSDKGKEARKYFIECEKKLRGKKQPEELIKEEVAVRSFKATRELAELFGLKGNQALLSANTAVKKLRGTDCMALLEINGLISENQIQYFTPTVIGITIGLSAATVNRLLEKHGLQTCTRDHKNRIVWIVTESGKNHCQLLDTGKKHTDGTPIMQIKWAESVKDVIE